MSLPEDRIIRNFRNETIADYSTRALEYQFGLFPMEFIFHASDWRLGFEEFWEYDKDKVRLFSQFETVVIKRFEQYQMPLILLRRPTPKDAVCQVFESARPMAPRRGALAAQD